MIRINENTLRKIIRETILEALDERGSNMQSLYHFTTVAPLAEIIASNCLKLSNWQEDTRGGNYMSFTRHKSGLEGFAKAAGRNNVRIEVDPVKINSVHGGGLAPFEYYSPKQFEINPFAKVERNSNLGQGMSAKEKYRVFGERFKDYHENEYMNQAEEHYLSPEEMKIPNAISVIKRIDICMPEDADEGIFDYDKSILEEIYNFGSQINNRIFIYSNARDFNLQTNNCMLLKDWLAFGTQNKYGKVVESIRKRIREDISRQIDKLLCEDYNAISAGAYVFCRDKNGEWCILAARRGDTAPSCPGMFNPPLGMREEGESVAECAARECYEESGIRIPPNKFIFSNYEEWAPGKIGSDWYAILDGDTSMHQPGPGDGENDPFMWIPMSQTGKLRWAYDSKKYLDLIYGKYIAPNDNRQLKSVVEENARKQLREYRERKSYRNQADAPFINRMNQFAQKYGYNPYTYGRSQGNPEDYAKQMLRQHNTFLRGVSTGIMGPEAREYAIQQLRKRGIQNPTEEQLAQFAATVPAVGRTGHYVSNTSNAAIYGSGSGNNDEFSGTAKVIRPYTLGNDRMKWFDDADFNVRDNSEFDAYDGENSVTKQVKNLNPGDIVDTWGDHTKNNTEILMGGESNFGGWLTPDEMNRYMYGNIPKNRLAAYQRERNQLYRAYSKNPTELNARLAALDRKYGVKSDDYSNWLTSKNNYYRGNQ